MTQEIAEMLEREAERINSPEFISADPVQFPRRFSRQDDAEVVSLLASHMAWGNRKMICNNIERLLTKMEGQPAAWVRNGAFEEVADEQNVHRTFFGRNLKHMMRGLERILSRHSTIDEWAATLNLQGRECAPWLLAEALNAEMAQANGCTDSRCLPLNLKTTALKRLNMALRWLVRNDGIVDMGLWSSLRPADLYIPLDVHVGDTARALGIITRRANDRRTTEEITAQMRSLRPDDPAFFDYALFGLGINKSLQ
ncbi:MAG: TIGR02757 family protein [Bacteroides sp.]|nr:TIGR02757 family protein [Bacteroides sp.]MCM1378961.1 TIGR02757 family protein [Bacteroides sp.]MCM1445577.1 TIGR02757 family protein [Prevotella sp.]